MTDKKQITPEIIEKIEDYLEERKRPGDRRDTNNAVETIPPDDRRSGKDRRDLAGYS